MVGGLLLNSRRPERDPKVLRAKHLQNTRNYCTMFRFMRQPEFLALLEAFMGEIPGRQVSGAQGRDVSNRPVLRAS
jgi:hypothetical protein